jgi:transposase
MRPKGTAGELEVRRRIAARLLLKGVRIREVGRLVGASSSSVKRWKDALDQGGLDALHSKPSPGREAYLSESDREVLLEILRQGPLVAGYDTEQWTCPRVGEVIEYHFGVQYHVDHVWRVLRALGWTCQKPEQRARERNEAAIERWRDKDWPRIKKGAPQAS